jgi:hypothetical protein
MRDISPYTKTSKRDLNFVKYAVPKKRLLAGLACSGARRLLFVIAEEGITTAAYAVIGTSMAVGQLKNAAIEIPLARASAPSCRP